MKINKETLGIMIGLLTLFIFAIFVFYIYNKQSTIICIGENSILFSSSDCDFCLEQEALFGKNVKFLNGIDCSVKPEICRERGIRVLPSWEIEEVIYKGKYSIKELRGITNC